MINTKEDTVSNISSYFGVKSDKLNRHYKHKVSGFHTWDQKSHASKYLIFPENIGLYLSIDEVSLSKGELYTFVTNKDGKGKKGTLVACIEGTKAEDIQRVLEMISIEKRLIVKEITLDMAKNMESGVKATFPNAALVTDRFHVVKLALDALQHIRVKFRWSEMDLENLALSNIKKLKNKQIEALEKYKNDPLQSKIIADEYQKKIALFKPIEFENGDSAKQLLARSRYILAKKENQWTKNQTQRAVILFEHYPDLKKAYNQVMLFRNIYEQKDYETAKVMFEKWIEKINKEEMKEFYTVANTVQNHLDNILNFFTYRHTNANAESFNAKIKLFRANLRGVVDTDFFLFRLHKLFA